VVLQNWVARRAEKRERAKTIALQDLGGAHE